MKITLANGNTYPIVTARRTFFVDRGVFNLAVEIPASSLSLDDASTVFTKENCTTVTISRDGKDDLVYTELIPSNVNQDLGATSDIITIYLDEEEATATESTSETQEA